MNKAATLKTAIKEKAKEKKGALLWELMLVLAILFIFLYCCISLLGVFVQYETLSHSTKSVARNIEVTGVYGYIGPSSPGGGESAINEQLEELLPDGFINIEHELTGCTLNERNQIQLRDTFTITVRATYEYRLPGFNGGLGVAGEPMNIEMSYTVTGMSEVYDRDF